MKRYYPAIISYDNEDKRYYADFPDFKGSVFTDAETYEEILTRAESVLKLMVTEYLETGRKLPEPEFSNQAQEGETVVSVGVWLTPLQDKAAQQIVRKNTSLPRWLATEAADAGYNFSEVLRFALLEKLGYSLQEGQYHKAEPAKVNK